MKAKILFFARDYQADFFIHLACPKYESLFVTLTKNEKKRIEKKGFEVIACFEEAYDNLPVSEFPNDYLESSFSTDRYQRFSSIFDRRIILGKEISFWAGLLDRYRPNLVVNETVAIEISEVLHLESRKRDIRYVSWMNLSIRDHFYWQSTPMHNSMDPEVFQQDPDEHSIAKAQNYIQNVKKGAGKPFYVNSVRGRYSMYSVAKNIYWSFRCILTEHRYRCKAKNRVIFGDNVDFYIDRLKDFTNSFFYHYDNFERFRQFEVVFYPLHYEPEAALFYMAEFFDNQIASIENYAKCLRHNQILVVKEHPQQPGILLQKTFRALKKRVPNLVFLPAEHSTVQLIERSKLILTLGSTAGIESMILGKPVVIMGKVFYDGYHKINKISNYDDLKEFIRKENNWKYPDENSLTTFLAQIIMHSQPGNPFPHDNLYAEANINNIIRAIQNELERVQVNAAI